MITIGDSDNFISIYGSFHIIPLKYFHFILFHWNIIIEVINQNLGRENPVLACAEMRSFLWFFYSVGFS